MKNIHVLPTDKPSRLYLHSYNELQIRSNIIRTSEDYLGSNQNIYITSDEKFVRDEYVTDGIEVIKANPKLVNAQSLVDRRDWKKIILTTDQDLIKDGVQSIDDEFLEWFVKNPSCEEVEVEKGCVLYDFKYKIIIPKEEPKQETLEEFINSQPYYGSCTTEYLEGIEIGAKWQQEQDKNKYSEEDLKEAFLDGWQLRDGDLPFPKAKKKWFEQFKKK